MQPWSRMLIRVILARMPLMIRDAYFRKKVSWRFFR